MLVVGVEQRLTIIRIVYHIKLFEELPNNIAATLNGQKRCLWRGHLVRFVFFDVETDLRWQFHAVLGNSEMKWTIFSHSLTHSYVDRFGISVLTSFRSFGSRFLISLLEIERKV